MNSLSTVINLELDMSAAAWCRSNGISKTRAYKDWSRGYCFLTTRGEKHDHPLYQTYRGMLNRCYRRSNHNYEFYGDRGIKVCGRWFYSFSNFTEDMGNKPGLEYSMDRIDNEGDYGPDNCRWATQTEQVRNSRRLLK